MPWVVANTKPGAYNIKGNNEILLSSLKHLILPSEDGPFQIHILAKGTFTLPFTQARNLRDLLESSFPLTPYIHPSYPLVPSALPGSGPLATSSTTTRSPALSSSACRTSLLTGPPASYCLAHLSPSLHTEARAPCKGKSGQVSFATSSLLVLHLP